MQRAPHWHSAPFLRLVIPFIAGIWSAESLKNQWFPTGTNRIAVLLVPVLITCLLYLLHHLRRRWSCLLRLKPALLGGLLIQCLAFSVGFLLFLHQYAPGDPKWFGNCRQPVKALVGTVSGLPGTGPKTTRYQFRIRALLTPEGKLSSHYGTVALYLARSSGDSLRPGELYALNPSTLKPITTAGNPGSFDYARYAAFRGLFHQAFPRPGSGDIIPLRPTPGLSPDKILSAGQTSAIRAIRETVQPSAQALAMALLIGYRDEVDRELLQAYSNTGVVHVIAVSGMHLGLIFLLLQHILWFPEEKYAAARWLKAALVLLIVWWFGGVAGAAASIIRAALMFSFMLLSKLLRKPADPIQSICLGAFGLLCYNPLWLWDAGFLLSFAALLSIVLYEPLVKPWLQCSNKLLAGGWQLVAVTLAAQVLTLPISISQFHQAPVYFLLANLVAVPLSSLALVTALLQWFCSSLHIPVELAGQVTGLLIGCMNAAIQLINQLPGAVLDQLEWDKAQTWLAYAALLSGTGWLLQKNRFLLHTTLLLLLLFQTIRLHDHFSKHQQQKLVVYHIPGKSGIELLEGPSGHRLLNRYSPPQHPVFTAAARHFRIREIKHHTAALYTFKNLRIAIPRSDQELEQLLPLKPDFLIITRQVRSIRRAMPLIPASTRVLLDGSLYEGKAAEWEKELRKAGLSPYNTHASGAFVARLEKRAGQ